MPEQPELAISSWSLHRALGLTYPNRPDRDVTPAAEPTYGAGRIDLLAMPAEIASLGVHRAEICSFHIPSRDGAYLGELKAALEQSGVVLQSLLIEYGDLTDPATHARDCDWMMRWMEAAAALGAERVRVIAGKAKPSPEALALSAEGLNALARHGAQLGISVVTENWFDLLPSAREVRTLFGMLHGGIGLNGDFGNWSGESKYSELARIFGLATCCHAKGEFSSGRLDTDDYSRCLDAAASTGFRGPFTLIYDGPDPDELAHLATERDFIRGYFDA